MADRDLIAKDSGLRLAPTARALNARLAATSNPLKKSVEEASVAVIGGGLAGLICAYQLAKTGAQVKLFEASSALGGRAKSQTFAHGMGSATTHDGAQMLSSGFTALMDVVRELDLESALIQLPFKNAIYDRGELRKLNHENFIALKESGLFSNAEWERIGTEIQQRWWSAVKGRSIEDAGDWADLDDQSADFFERWGKQGEKYVGVFVEALYLQSIEKISRVAFLSLMAALANEEETFSFEDGFGVLIDAVQRKLESSPNVQLHLNCPVSQVSRDSEQVVLLRGVESERFDHAISTTPARTALRLCSQLAPYEKELLELPYITAMNVKLVLKRNFQHLKALDGTYSIGVERNGRLAGGSIASVSLEAGRRRRQDACEVVQLMLHTDGAKANWALCDEALIKTLMTELSVYTNTELSSADVERFEVLRWEDALPVSPPGRLGTIKAYYEQLPIQSPLGFAGDYMGMPSTGAAAFSATLAAVHFVHRFGAGALLAVSEAGDGRRIRLPATTSAERFGS